MPGSAEQRAGPTPRTRRDAERRLTPQVRRCMAWAIDRLGRSLVDLLSTVQTLEACGVDLFLEQQSLDTTMPAGKLCFKFAGPSLSLNDR